MITSMNIVQLLKLDKTSMELGIQVFYLSILPQNFLVLMHKLLTHAPQVQEALLINDRNNH